MAKVTTERPRSGGKDRLKGENRKFQKEPWDEKPKRESIRKKYRVAGVDKEFTDVLGPLYGYLLKQVDRPWNDVWSEICSHLPANSVQGSHIRDHVFDFVELDVQMIDGVPHHTEGYKFYSWRQFLLYVHPETGILSKISNKGRLSKISKRKPVYNIVYRKDKTYVKHDDIWYLVKFTQVPLFQKYQIQKDGKWIWIYDYKNKFLCQLQKRYIKYDDAMSLYGKQIVCTNKQQISSSEIRKQELRR